MNKLRIGLGIDAHPFVTPSANDAEQENCLKLGGVSFSNLPPLQAHSDGDVLIHALMDALLSAARLPSIGELFPDSAAEYKQVDSAFLLAEVQTSVARAGWQIADVDCVVCAQTPQIAGCAMRIRQSLAELLQISADNVGVKGTSLNGMDSIGRGEGIQAQVAVILCQ